MPGPRPIAEVARDLGLAPAEWAPWGRARAKVFVEALAARAGGAAGRLVLVTALTPTPTGDGKTTMTIGLGDALWRLGARPVIALRQPSMGPTLGMKGGGTGGGRAQLHPMEDINLHFTGDFHAVAAAHNLLAAALDNHLHHGNPLGLDPRQVLWPRAIDVNDRALRRIVVGLGGPADGVPREEAFLITAASEVMAALCLADGLADLRQRLGRMLVALTPDDRPVAAEALGVAGAMAALLREAIHPNLVQTLEGRPALVHGGPFGNIAHGCSSVLATRLALRLGDLCLTEAGFGTELGAEKFFDIKCRLAGLRPDAAVLVVTARALKYQGGVAPAALEGEDPEALGRGLANLEAHMGILRQFGVPAVVAVNRWASDTDREVQAIVDHCAGLGVVARPADVFARGGEGGLEVGRALLALLEAGPARFAPLYGLEEPVKAKLEAVATRAYGAEGVEYTDRAERRIARAEALGYGGLPVCVAKTQRSLSDNPALLGRPRGFRITVRDLRIAAGAGFLVAMAGDITTMPGLPRHPNAERLDVAADGGITGLF